MDSWTVNILLIEGLPLLGFIYYLEYKKNMYLLEKEGSKKQSVSSLKEKKLVKGLFLVLAGSALVIAPGIAGIFGFSAELSLETVLIGTIIISAGLAILIGCGIFKVKGISLTEERGELE
ncbi:MAG: hypothetical protein ACE14P_05775 [Methanotrichaceae archaeon]